ncbi:Electron transfer flavoprotein-ubiquinone oxidoreductase [Sedimentisphaera cyanobacteriorum]|uniref:Electron transfer flavoprotein-ubiquinone oxidoreductase n=1 Tax=Sedimentisphaera cyanobacteriorum TaxID=1940790 RepID=A0A1Q2HSZ7_9BACT|nr:electron-transfer flavoprotein:ubiquinone oxidoreductase [Sedimentisphaera cyanobacteriorum]AQQ10501.1 Electron transfer flavoprotein-ubiquinone oxidoreductase [Sedimentisphaera cyanobacteriorum]
MNKFADYKTVDVLVVGAGVAGLTAAAAAKSLCPDKSVCVIDKASGPGRHNLSGGTFDPSSLYEFLNLAFPNWQDNEKISKFLSRRVVNEQFFMLSSKSRAFRITPHLKLAKALKLSAGKMLSEGETIISVSKLVRVVEAMAVEKGVEIYYNFPADFVDFDHKTARAKGVRLADKGLDEGGIKQMNYTPGELINAENVILAEGADGYVTEQFIAHSELERNQPQIYSLGVKEVIEVSPEQYKAIGSSNVLRFAGYPLWKPFSSPSIFGGGALYPLGSRRIAVVLISALDWKYKDYSPYEAFCLFKKHPKVARYIDGGRVLEAGAKLIPEGGFHSIPRDKVRSTYAGTSNVLLTGDCAGFVNMHRMRGLSNAVLTGLQAGKAVSMKEKNGGSLAKNYSNMLEFSGLIDQMKRAAKFRQIISKFGVTLGLGLGNIDFMLPLFNIRQDNKREMTESYPFSGKGLFDQADFVKHTGVQHRENQQPHLVIKDVDICKWECARKYDCPCLKFCPGQVYEKMQEHVGPVNTSNCLHCKTCQRKCPYSNIEWTVPEAGGPMYTDM